MNWREWENEVVCFKLNNHGMGATWEDSITVEDLYQAFKARMIEERANDIAIMHAQMAMKGGKND